MNKQNSDWEVEFERLWGGEGRYLCLYNNGMDAYTSVPEEVKSFISRLLETEREKIKEFVLNQKNQNEGGTTKFVDAHELVCWLVDYPNK